MAQRSPSVFDKDARIAELEAAVAARDTLIETLRVQLAQLRRLTFGRSSEKLTRQIEQLELALGELESEAEAVPAPVSTPVQRERAPLRRTLPDHLPRIELRIEPTTANCACPACGGALRLVLPPFHRTLRRLRFALR